MCLPTETGPHPKILPGSAVKIVTAPSYWCNLRWKPRGTGAFPLDPALLDRTADVSSLEHQVAEAYRLLSPIVQRHLFLLLRDTQECEDITQEVFLRLFQQLRAGETVREPRAWILKVARNLAFDRLRSRPNEPIVEGEWAAMPPEVEQRLLANEKHKRMMEALSTLSPQEKQSLELRSEGLKYREIAAVLDVSISTVQTAIERALRKLSRRIHE